MSLLPEDEGETLLQLDSCLSVCCHHPLFVLLSLVCFSLHEKVDKWRDSVTCQYHESNGLCDPAYKPTFN